MKKNFKGFTYYELLIVVAIMSLMAAFVTISLGTINRNNVHRTADGIESACKGARNNAISKGSDNGYVTFYYKDNKLYSYIGEKVTNTFSFASDTRDWNIVSNKLEDFDISYTGNPTGENIANGQLVCISFKQSTGELIGWTNVYAGYDYPCNEITFTLSNSNSHAGVKIEKFGNITVQ